MAAKPENLARTAINKLIPAEIHREKMGSGFSAGTADQWYSADPFDMWVEYKFLKSPPKREFQLDLSVLQRRWLNARYQEGRAVCVILCFPAKYGCWVFTTQSWEGKINPAECVLMTRKDVAAFITRSCTDRANYRALIRHGQSG